MGADFRCEMNIRSPLWKPMATRLPSRTPPKNAREKAAPSGEKTSLGTFSWPKKDAPQSALESARWSRRKELENQLAGTPRGVVPEGVPVRVCPLIRFY